MISTLQVIRRFAFREWGGTETVVWNTSQELQRLGNNVEIISTQALAETKAEIREDISIRRFPYIYPYLNLTKTKKEALDKKGGDPYSWSLYNYMLKKENLDIIHCHTMNRIAASVRLAAKKRKIPYLVSFHGGHFDVPAREMELMIQPYKHTFNYGKLIDILVSKERYLTDADAIICVGYNEYEITKDKYPQKLVYYLPNGVDIDKFKPLTKNDFRKKYQIPGDEKMILCLSRIDYQKNQAILIDLIERLKGRGERANLVLLGPVTSTQYLAELNRLIMMKSLEQQVTIIPGLQADNADLMKAYQAADVFILPSIHEPFGIVVLEAWASGVPVIASKVGGLQSLVQSGRNGLAFDGSLAELERNYLELIHNDRLREELILNAGAEVKAEYSWRSVTEKLMAYYSEIKDKCRICQ
ncbi:MAG: glycosyltransferase family 4 protein [Candidatus Cloacimonetes bacterium]|nr:glycosyltransferase family 4 protein [Candidatus Cloacimonadota bacterium]